MDKFFYLYQVLDVFNNIAIVIFAFSCLALFVSIICAIVSHCSSYYDGTSYEEEHKKDVKKAIKCLYISITFFVLNGSILIFVPSGKTYALMCGGKIIEKTIEENPEAKEIPSKTINLINNYLEKLIEENNE